MSDEFLRVFHAASDLWVAIAITYLILRAAK